MHRLRGLCNLIGGWALLGESEGIETKIEAYMQESAILFDRAERLCILLAKVPRTKDFNDQATTSMILASALGMGTPEEAGNNLPICTSPTRSLELALALQALRCGFGGQHDADTVTIGYTQTMTTFSFGDDVPDEKSLMFNLEISKDFRLEDGVISCSSNLFSNPQLANS